nr:DUF2511 domain-containing protein [Pseudomonas sp. BIGb0427]
MTSQEYGEDWPFTVESVELMCEPGPPKALLKVPDGTVYALNASASQSWPKSAAGLTLTRSQSRVAG